jgi:hypothetical protein
MKCTKCSIELDEGVAFCANCGLPVPAIPGEIKSLCPKCNHELVPGVAFCGNCGQQVSVLPTASASDVVPSEAPTVLNTAGIASAASSGLSDTSVAVAAPDAAPQPTVGLTSPAAAAVIPPIVVTTPVSTKPINNTRMYIGFATVLLGLLILYVFGGWLGLILIPSGIIQLVMSYRANKSKLALAGIILGGIGLVLFGIGVLSIILSGQA